ncbi:hypothetical protein NP493_312g03002 [Ridgeia piscesae]|uniref:Uncharacterized protein n=1 Tax=Ridgeia piscesae TaxID=27915 RepID=A0AAD9NV15_RIDPI|nr:hypothetical protein NP493_312g03002 [Ridgeia piscesae]
MCSSRAEVEIVRSNIDVLVKEGLGPRAEHDYGLAAETCTVLLKLAGTHKGVRPVYYLWSGGVVRLDQSQWIPMAEQAVCVIYRLAEHPDCICTDIIKHVAEVVLNNHEQGEPPEAAPATPEEG